MPDVKIHYHTSTREAEPIRFNTEIAENGGINWVRVQVCDTSVNIFTSSREESTKLLRDLLNETLRCLTTPKEEDSK